MSLLNELSEILQQTDGERVQPMPAGSTDLFGTLNAMVPYRCFDYDSECVDDVSYYAVLLREHANLTLSEFNPVAINVAGSLEDRVCVTFEHANERHALEFPQHGTDYVTPDFYDALNGFGERYLGGRYVIFPTSDQTMACAYLPRPAAALVKGGDLRAATTDSVVDFILGGGDPDTLNWFDIPFPVRTGYTTAGESIATAIVKARLVAKNSLYSSNCSRTEGILESFAEGDHVYEFQQNLMGETPLQLAYELHPADRNLHRLMRREVATVGFDFVEQHRYELPPEIEPIVDLSAAQLQLMHFNPEFYPWLQFSHQPNFVVGEDTCSLLFNGEMFEVHVQTPGAEGGVILEEHGLDESRRVADIVKRYCNGERWS